MYEMQPIHIWDATHSYLLEDAFVYKAWLSMYTEKKRGGVSNDSFIYGDPFVYQTWLCIHTEWVMTHSYMAIHPFVYQTWLCIHTEWVMTHSYMAIHPFVYQTWLCIHTEDRHIWMSHYSLYKWIHSYIWHDFAYKPRKKEKKRGEGGGV